MGDGRKTKAQLIEELAELRERLAALEEAKASRQPRPLGQEQPCPHEELRRQARQPEEAVGSTELRVVGLTAELAAANAGLQRCKRELDALHGISQTLVGTLDMQQVYRAIYRKVAQEMLGAPHFTVALYDAATQTISCGFAVVDGEEIDPGKFPVTPLGEGPVSEAIRTRQPMIVDLGRVMPPLIERGRAVIVGDERMPLSGLYVPLVWGDKLYGIMVAQHYEANAFSEADQALAAVLAGQAAMALENTRLFDRARQEIAQRRKAMAETHRRLVEATFLHRMSSLMASAVGVTDVLKGLCSELAGFLQVPQAGFALLNPERTAAEVIADHHPPDSPSAIGALIPVDGNPSMAHILETKAPIAVSRAQTDPAMAPVHDLMRRRKVESILLVPVIADRQVIGTLGFDSFEPREFSQADISLVQDVANQAGQVLMRRRAEEDARRWAEELDALQRTVLEITVPNNLSTLLETIMERAAQLLRAPSGGLYLCEEGGVRCVVSYRTPTDYRGLALRYGEGVAGRVAQTGTPLNLDDYAAWPDRMAVFLENPPCRAVLAVPMIWQQRVIGVIDVADRKEGRRFTRSDQELLWLFATHAAIAVENARLLEAERTAREQTEVLRDAAQTLGASLDANDILRSILEQLRRVMVYDTASVLALRGDGMPDLVVGLGYRDEAATSREAGRLLRDSPILSQMRHDLLPVVSGDVRHLEGWTWVPGAEHVRSWMGIPLVAQGRMIGALMVDHSAPGFYGEADLKVAQALAQTAAQALENARLFEAEQRRALELSTLLESTRAVSSTLALDQVLALIAEQAVKALDVGGCALSGWDRDADAVVTWIDYRRDRIAPNPPHTIFPLKDYPATRAVLESRQPQIIYADDHEADPAEVALMRHLGTTSLLMLPLVAGDEVIGLVELDTGADHHHFDSSDVRLAQAMANQAAIAIQNSRLFEEQLRAERRLEERRRYLEAVLACAPDAIVTLDAQHRIVEWNAGAEVLFGYSRAEAIGRDLDSLVTNADTLDEALSITRRVLGGQDLPPTEAIRTRKDGSPVHVLLAGSPILMEGELTGIVGVYTEIGRLQRAQQALQESENKLRGILSSMVDLVFAFDQEGRFTFYHSPSTSDLYVPPGEFLGRTYSEVLPQQISVLFAQAFERNRRGEAAQVEYWLELSGRKRWFAVNSSPLFSDGEFRGAVAVAREITERKLAEETLREANRGLRLLSECNRLLSHAREERDLLNEICEIAVNVGGYRLAWVGYAEEGVDKLVRPVGQAGFEEGYLDRIRITWDDTERGRGPTGRAIRTGQVAIARNIQVDPDFAPWRQEAMRRGYGSSIALPLKADGRCLGALCIYASKPEAFDEQEARLLTELAGNLAYAIMALRTRAERDRAEEELHRYAQRLEFLHQVDRAILEAQSPRDIAEGTLAGIERLVPCDQASIGAFGLEGDRPTLLAALTSKAASSLPWLGHPLEAFEVTDEFRRGQPRVVREVLFPAAGQGRALWPGPRSLGSPPGEGRQRRSRPGSRPAAGEVGEQAGEVRSVIYIPLVAEGELIGVLHLASGNPGAFPPEQIEVAYEVAAPLALAIQHARFHEQLQQYADSLEETVARRTWELKAERDRTQAILESLGEAVIVTDMEGKILYTNPATELLTGYRNDEVAGNNWRLLQGDGQSDEVFELVRIAMGNRQTWRGEMVSRRKDHSSYDAAVTVAPLFDPDDAAQLVGSVWVQRDVTLLKEAARLKDEFVSNVSHELRTPLSILTLVAGNLDRLYGRLEDEKRRQMIKTIREQVGVLGDLIGDVLEISRINGGRVSRERGWVDLVELVREEVDRQSPLARRKRQGLVVGGLDSLALRGNEGQLRQVIRNLLNNAIKFTPDGGTITCECLSRSAGEPTSASSVEPWGSGWPGSAGLSPGRWAALRVVDTGIGIGQEDLPHVFERFFRVHSQGDIPGTGLGLAITRELVALHGGHIAVESEPGRGSVFAVYLRVGDE